MTRIKNLPKIGHHYGKAAPKLLAAAILAALLGIGGYSMFGGSGKDQNGSIADEVNTPEDAAAALYSSILSEDYSHNVRLVAKLRNLDFEKQNELPASAMTEDDRNRPVNIAPYLSEVALQEVEKRIRSYEEHLVNRQSTANYKFYVDSLASIFTFYHSLDPDISDMERTIAAYQAFDKNIDYTINDIRSLYGAVNALRVCRFLIGEGNYSRLSPFDMRDFITLEVNKLIQKLPVDPEERVRSISEYNAEDFAILNPEKLHEVQKLNLSLPSVINYISLIDGIKPDQRTRNYNSIRENYSKTLTQSQSFLDRARVFYECRLNTAAPFTVTAKGTGKIFKDVALSGKLQLNAVEMKIATPVASCENMDTIYVLVPEINDYQELLNRGINKMGDSDRTMFKTDLALLAGIYAGQKEIPLSINASEVAAVENPLEQNPRQGRFVGTQESGPLFNVNLNSMKLLETLEISPESTQMFRQSGQTGESYRRSRQMLHLLQEFVRTEDSMSSLDFERLNQDPFHYLYERSREFYADSLEQQEKDLNAASVNVADTVLAASAAENESSSQGSPEYNGLNADASHTLVISEVETPEPAPENPVSPPEPEKPAPDAPETAPVTAENTPVTPEPEKPALPPAEPESPVPESPVVAVMTEEDKPQEAAPEKPLLTPRELRDAKTEVLKSEIARNNQDAVYELAIRNINGIKGVKKNLKEGETLLEKSAASGNRDAAYMLGSIYLNKPKKTAQDTEKGIALIIAAADKGHADALNDAGHFYYEGKHVPRDYQKALDYLLRASEHDNKDADYLLALMYRDGHGVSRNLESEISYLTRAAKGRYGIPKASYDLAEIYASDLDPRKKDEKKAREYYIDAARKNVKEAFRPAGIALLKQNPSSFEGAKYLSGSLTKNDPEAEALLMNYYIKTNDTRELLKYIAKAPKNVQEQHPLEMGIMYDQGINVKKDYAQAEKYYRMAIKDGKSAAFCHLGDMFREGRGVQKDMRAAVGQYTQGSMKNEPSCMKQLAYIKLTEPRYTNANEAYALLDKAVHSDRSDKKAAQYLGAMKVYGEGTPKDEAEGIRLLRNSGLKPAQFLSNLVSGDRNLKNCSSPVQAGVYGIKSWDRSWLAAASMKDPLFLKYYLDAGGTLDLEKLEADAARACKGDSLLYAGKGSPAENSEKADDQFNTAMKHYRAKNYAQALSFLEKAAAQGHLRALNNLGVFQLFGIGTGKNGAQAFTTLMKAASKGDVKASMLSSAIRMYGIEGGPRDPGKSIAFLTDMADRGNSMAAEHLVALYTMGLGVGKHDGLAFLNFMKLGR
ncbi:hypothetical protein [Succinimonas sp.]|uniref:hypothetical protein n=1 Tax=Succinimonas sp. TaxID=1936151 RepID=UPI0038645E70